MRRDARARRGVRQYPLYGGLYLARGGVKAEQDAGVQGCGHVGRQFLGGEEEVTEGERAFVDGRHAQRNVCPVAVPQRDDGPDAEPQRPRPVLAHRDRATAQLRRIALDHARVQ